MRTKLLKRLRKRAKKMYWIEVDPDCVSKYYMIMRKMGNTGFVEEGSYNFIGACRILNKYRRIMIEGWVKNKKRSKGRYKLDI